MEQNNKWFRLDIKIESKNVELISDSQEDEKGNLWVDLEFTPTKEEFLQYTGCWRALITEKYYRCVKPIERVVAE